MRHTKWRPKVAACLVALAAGLGGTVALLAAGSASATTKTPAKSVKAHGAPVHIFSIGVVNSPANSYPTQPAAEQAAIQAINASGGVGLDHHPLQLTFCDSQESPNQDALCVQEAIADHVVADVSSIDLFSPVSLPVLAAAGIPAVADLPVYQSDFTNSDNFPLFGGANWPEYAYAWALKKYNDSTKIALVTSSAAVNEEVAGIVVDGINQVGSTDLGQVLVPPSGVSDWTPYAEQLANLHAQAIATVTPVSNLVPLMEAYAQLGAPKVTWIAPGSFTPATLAACGSVCDGAINTETTPPLSDTSNPDIKLLLKQMAAANLVGVAGAQPSDLSLATTNAWAGIYAFKDLLAHTRGVPTAATVLALLRSPKSKNISVPFGTWSPGGKGPSSLFGNLTNGTIYLTEIKNHVDTLLGTKKHPDIYNLFQELGLTKK